MFLRHIIIYGFVIININFKLLGIQNDLYNTYYIKAILNMYTSKTCITGELYQISIISHIL